MNDTSQIFGLPKYAERYKNLWDAYVKCGVSEALDLTDKELSNAKVEILGGWERKHYFDVGADALRIICQSLMASQRDIPHRILDFPSGSGRVTRHLRAMFPDATIGACDLYQSHIQFCADNFSALPLLSRENFDDLDVGQWDVIFCGSLLSHLPKGLFWKAIDFLVRSLAPNGIAIVTLEGRHSLYIQDNKWKFIEDELFEVAREGYYEHGFGFVDYKGKVRDIFCNQETYGVALTNPGWLMNGLMKMDQIRVLNFVEREWDDHQDVVVFGKPGVNE